MQGSSVLKFESTALNVWAAKRDGQKIAEIVATMGENTQRLIPVEGLVYTPDELVSLATFMETAHCQGASVKACAVCPLEGRCEWM